MPITAVSKEPRIPDIPNQKNPGSASGDRLHFPGFGEAPVKWSHDVPAWLQPFTESLSGEPHDSHNVVVEQPVVEPQEKTPDDMSVSSEEWLPNLRSIASRSMRPNTSKPTGKHNVFTHVPEDPDGEVCHLTNKLPELCADTAHKREETVFIIRQHLEML